MLGNLSKDQFDPQKNYEEFYVGHKFEPFPKPFDAHEVLPRAAWTLDIADQLKATSLLDLCCLDGFVPLTMAKHCATLTKIHGVDLSEPGIKRAKDLTLELNGRDIKFYQDSVERFLETTKGKYDMILMYEAVEHFKDTPYVIDLAKKHLTSRGQILISTPDAEEFYGIGNHDACHLRYYSHRGEEDWDDLTRIWEGRPILSLPDEIESLGGTVCENQVWNSLIHLRASF